MKSPLSADELVSRLKASDLFSDLEERDLQLIASSMETISLEDGTCLIRQGDSADRLFVIIDGTLEASIAGTEGEAQTIRKMGPGETVGEVAILAGGERTATVTATGHATVAALTADALDQLTRTRPETADALTTLVVGRLRRSQLATHLSRLFGTLELDALRDIERVVEWIRLPSGEVLFEQGDSADAAYVLISGRLRVAIVDAEGNEQVVNEVGRGEAVGEIALLTHGRRSATVYAVRESDLARFSRAAFDSLTEKYPGAMVQMARLIGTRLQNVQAGAAQRRLRVDSIALLPLHESVDLGQIAGKLTSSMSSWGSVRRVSAADVDQAMGRTGVAQAPSSDPSHIRLTSWLGEQDLLHDFVVFEADHEWSMWTERVVREADLVVLVADAKKDPAVTEVEQRLDTSTTDRRSRRQTLLLVHPPDVQRPSGTARWLDPRPVESHHHVRLDRDGDFDRVGRILTGNAFGLALGGGGARGFAHLGVYRALVESGVPIDIVGGTSQGAIIAANIALGWTPAEAIQGCRRHFTSLFDYTLPMISVIAARRINSELRAGFAETDIEDLWIPFVCVSTNLTRASQVVHSRGKLWRAVRASISLPGVMPPVYENGDLLVDGGLLNNLPADVVRSISSGTLIAVDVTPKLDLTAAEAFEPEVSGWAAFWQKIKPFGQRRSYPSILSILTRSSVLSSIQARNRLQNEQAADLYLHPQVAEWPMLDFDSLEAIAERGYESTARQIREWYATL